MGPPKNGIIAPIKFGFYLLFILKFPALREQTPRIVHLLWECISWFCVILPFPMGMCFLKTVYDKFDTEPMPVLSNIGMQGVWLQFSFLTMLHFKLKSKFLENMSNIIESEFQWRSAAGKTYVDMSRIYRYAKIVAITWMTVPASVMTFQVLKPLFIRPVVLPLDVWSPFDRNNPYAFATMYFLQAWSQVMTVWAFVMVSSYFFGFGLLCCGQFNILMCSIKNLIFTSGLYKKFPEALHINNELDCSEYLFANEMRDSTYTLNRELIIEDIDAHHTVTKTTTSKNTPTPLLLLPADLHCFRKTMINCIEQHLLLLKLCRMMESYNAFLSLLRISELTLQICFMAFVYSKTADILIFFYGFLACVDVFFLTYLVDHIRDQNHAVGMSLLKGPWYLLSKYFRNDFLMINLCSQFTIKFTAGKIIEIKADRLKQVLTTAFSYYTLLSSFDQA